MKQFLRDFGALSLATIGAFLLIVSFALEYTDNTRLRKMIGEKHLTVTCSGVITVINERFYTCQEGWEVK